MRLKTGTDSYERVVGEGGSTTVHRLAAVAWYGLDAVRGRDVHHESGVEWDNREANISVLTRSEHLKRHDTAGTGRTKDYRDRETMRELYVVRGLSTREVAVELGCSQHTVRTWLDRLGIGTRTQSEAQKCQ